MFNRKMLLFVSAFSFWALGARADVACVKQDCATLGYTKTLAQCSGADNIIKCPFDTSKVACNTPVTISTPIFDILYNWASLYCQIDQGLDADISQCITENFSNKDALCSEWSALDLNMDIYSCKKSADVDIASINTMQDLVSMVESVLITKIDPCADATEYDPEWQTCDNVCKDSTSSSSKHYCFATPQAIPCLVAIREAGGIVLETDTAISSGNTYFMTSGSTLGEITDSNSVTFVPATKLAACDHDPSIVDKNPILIVEDLFIDGSKSEISFYVPVVINNLAYSNYSVPASLSFYADGAIKSAELNNVSTLRINAMDNTKIRAKFSSCTGGSCYVDFNGTAGSTHAMLEYCASEYNSQISVYCHDQTCTETCPIYFH